MEEYFDYREEYTHFGKIHGTIIESDKAVYKYRHTDDRAGFQAKTPDQGTVLGEGLIEGPMPFEKEECMTYRIAEDGIAFLKKYADGDKPFMLHFSFPDPHWPNVAPEPYYSMYDTKDAIIDCLDIDWSTHPIAHYVQSISAGFDKYTLDERKRITATMYGQMTFIDDAMGMFLDEVERLGLYENTIIVFVSDHGNFGGRFGLVGKTKAFYDTLVRIPCIIHVPGIDGGKTIDAKLENIDIMPTIAEHIDIQAQEGIHGQSFLSVLESGLGEHREIIFCETGLNQAPPPVMPIGELNEYAKMRKEKDGPSWFLDYTVKGRSAMIIKGEWKYNHYVGDKEELYNLKNDPLELTNLAKDSRQKAKLFELRDIMLDKYMTTSMEKDNW
jgi:arylsulfatase A-like enzyme